MRRHIFVSDIHGDYKKLAEALAEAKFRREEDILVCLGDIFDRGQKSLEVLQFLMGLPRKILVWGNHDYRLRELICGDQITMADYQNGVLATLHSLCPNHKTIESIDILLRILQTDAQYADTYKLLWQYFDTCVWAVEWDGVIATHGWLPYCGTIPARGATKTQPIFQLRPDWRHAPRNIWYEASWAHTEACIMSGIFPDKPLIVGHWHAWRLWSKFKEIDPRYAPWETYIHFAANEPVLMCIDGCVNAEGGIVNTLSLNLEENYKTY